MPYNGIQSIGIRLLVYAVLNFNYAFFKKKKIAMLNGFQ